MGFKMNKGDGPNSELNVTPLIDIVLVMLIIFMVITPRTINELAANLPSKTKQTHDKKEISDQLVVAAYADGRVALNRREMSLPELADQLRRRLRARSSKVVFVDADPNANYGFVVKVMDLVRDAGADRVGLARLKDEGPPPPVAGDAPSEGPPAEAP